VRRRPRAVRLAVRALAVGVAGALTVLLAQVPVGATFTATTVDGTNRVGTAANFCEKTEFVTASAVAWTDQAAPTTNQPDTGTLRVRSRTAAGARTWVRFDLPPAKPGCILQAATLRLQNRVPGSPTIVDAFLGDTAAPAWTPGTITWDNQPRGLGTGIGGSIMTAPGTQVWGVTDEVRQQYTTGLNNGFVLQDRYENGGTGIEQQYDGVLTSPTAPHVQLDWR
jgi:hypothetical protein